MKALYLIEKSTVHLQAYPHALDNVFSLNAFEYGAYWMHQRLILLDHRKVNDFNRNINFTLYGILKYALCLLAFLGSLVYLISIHYLLAPLTIIIFYILEIHFLFLFPLLLDEVDHPLRTSLNLTYKLGFFNLLFTVIPIGIYMVRGLTNWKNPLKNWYVGCLAILIWYTDEVRDRI